MTPAAAGVPGATAALGRARTHVGGDDPGRGAPVVVVVAGLGNQYRRDDGVGLLVASRSAGTMAWVRDVGPLTDPLDLLGRWDDADLAVVVDAVRSGAPPGTVSVLAVPLEPQVDDHGEGVGGGPGHGAVPLAGRGHSGSGTSTHGIGLARVLHLARLLGQAPRRVAVVGIEGQDFTRGVGLSPAVAAAVPDALDRIIELTREVGACA